MSPQQQLKEIWGIVELKDGQIFVGKISVNVMTISMPQLGDIEAFQKNIPVSRVYKITECDEPMARIHHIRNRNLDASLVVENG